MDQEPGQAPGAGTGRGSSDTVPLPTKFTMPMPGAGKTQEQWLAEAMARGPSDPGFAPQAMPTVRTFLGLGHWLLAETQAEALHRALDQAQQFFKAMSNGMKLSLQHKDSSCVVCVGVCVCVCVSVSVSMCVSMSVSLNVHVDS